MYLLARVQRTTEIGSCIYVKTGARLGHDQGERATPELERLETRSSGCDAQARYFTNSHLRFADQPRGPLVQTNGDYFSAMFGPTKRRDASHQPPRREVQAMGTRLKRRRFAPFLPRNSSCLGQERLGSLGDCSGHSHSIIFEPLNRLFYLAFCASRRSDTVRHTVETDRRRAIERDRSRKKRSTCCRIRSFRITTRSGPGEF